MKKLLLLFALAGCVAPSQMDACKNMCAPRAVLSVSQTQCVCESSAGEKK